MVAVGAVRINDLRQGKEIILKCHRHGDAFQMLKEFGYERHKDYEILEEGFLNENDEFLTRGRAYREAVRCHQIKSITDRVLYSEDVW